MAQAPRVDASHDKNFVPTLLAVSSVDGTTPVPVEADPTTGALLVSGSSGGGGATVVGIGPVGQNQIAYDTVIYTNSSSTVDTYTYKSGGISGSTTATVTITFTDATKSILSSVVRT